MNTGKLVKIDIKEWMFVLGQAKVEVTVKMIINTVVIYQKFTTPRVIKLWELYYYLEL